MNIEFEWQYGDQEPLHLNTDMIQEDVLKYQMGIPKEGEG